MKYFLSLLLLCAFPLLSLAGEAEVAFHFYKIKKERLANATSKSRCPCGPGCQCAPCVCDDAQPLPKYVLPNGRKAQERTAKRPEPIRPPQYRSLKYYFTPPPVPTSFAQPMYPQPQPMYAQSMMLRPMMMGGFGGGGGCVGGG